MDDIGFLRDLTTLDIRSPNRSLFKVSRRELDNLPYEHITPKIFTVIYKVVCGNKLIWERKSLGLVEVGVTYYSGAICFVCVSHGNCDDHFLINDRGDFDQVHKAVYFKKANELSRSVPVKGYITIELTKNNTTKFYRVSKSGKYYPVIYTWPKIGYICRKVTYEGATLWETEGDSARCIKTTLYTSEDPLQCALVVCIGNDRKSLYYTRNTDGWALIDKETYDSIGKEPEDKPDPPVRYAYQEKIVERVTGITFDKMRSP